MKLLSAAIVLATAPLAFARNNAIYPTEKVPAFVVQQLDVTTLPSELRPKHAKGKKTLADFGFATQNVGDQESLVESGHGAPQFTLKILEQNPNGIYVCADSPVPNAESSTFQRVLVLKRKDTTGLLKSRETLKEFASCPSIGGEDNSPADGK